MGSLIIDCEQSYASLPIVLNSTQGRVCGLANPTNSSRLSSCCNNNPIQRYRCTEYCNTDLNSQQLVDCLEEDEEEPDNILGLEPFCQEGIMGNVTARLSRSGSTRRMGSSSLQILLWMTMLSLIVTVNRAIVPSLSTKSLIKRQQASEACTIELISNRTGTGRSKAVSSRFSCGERPFCTFGLPIDTGILENNRTINGTSAAEPEYDNFFDNLQNKTSRIFPALSSAELRYDVAVGRSASFHVAFTYARWCATMITNCKGIGGEGDGMKTVEACGPTFVSDYAEEQHDIAGAEMIIQGTLSTVINA